jgi:hypothetical protein
MSATSFAHPVIYQGGWVASSYNMPSNSTNTLMYSFTSKFAGGVEHWRFKPEETENVGFLKLNHLLWRKNGDDYQANVYLHGGFGTAATFLGAVEGDWETRRYYTSFKHYEFHNGRGFDRTMSQARIGYSPFLKDFNSLQTWFMLQFMHMREVEKEVMITPMVRFFYHNFLWEAGSSIKGDWMLNLMVHF